MNKFWRMLFFITGIVFLAVPLALFGTCILGNGIGGIFDIMFSKKNHSTNMLSTILGFGFSTLLIIIGYFIFRRIIDWIRKGPK